MDYKKAYKEALERARKLHGGPDDAEIEEIFPELRESESKDERIRKRLLFLCDEWEFHPDHRTTPIEEDVNEIRAWLEKQKEQKPLSTEETELNSIAFLEQMGYTCIPPGKEHKPILEVFGFKVGDAVRLKDGDGRKHIIKSFEEVKAIHGPNYYNVEFEDNSAIGGIYPGIAYPDGYYTQMEKIEEEQKPIQDSIEKKYIRTLKCLISDFLRGKDEVDTEYYQKIDDWLDGRHIEQKPAECLKAEKDGWYVCIKDYYRGGRKRSSVGDLVQAKGGMHIMGEKDISEWFRRAYYEEVRDAFGPNTDMNISQKPAEWSEEDEKYLKIAINIVASDFGEDCPTVSWLKSLRPKPHTVAIKDATKFGNLEYERGVKDGVQSEKSRHWKPSEEQMEVDLEKLVNEEFASHCRTTEYGLVATYNYAELYQLIKRMALVFNARKEVNK